MKNDQPPVPPDAFADLLPVEALYIAPGEYEMIAQTGQRLFYVEGSALAEWLRDRINAVPIPRTKFKKKSRSGLQRGLLTIPVHIRPAVHEPQASRLTFSLLCAMNENAPCASSKSTAKVMSARTTVGPRFHRPSGKESKP